MNDETQHFTLFTDDELETWRRRNAGEPIGDTAVLQLLGVDLQAACELVEEVAELATPITNDKGLWGALNDLRVFLVSIRKDSGATERHWRPIAAQ